MFIKAVRLDDLPASGYPFDLPVVRALHTRGGLRLPTPVTLLAGDNGSGKSTLIEAIAVAAGFNPEGGTTAFNFATRATESTLGGHLTLSRVPGRKPRTGFFLRAESFYNVATEIDQLGATGSYGGTSLHERSHGESFLDLATHRFGPGGLYLLDEPEAALSVNGCLALLLRIAELTALGSQFVIATHSPILLACPDSAIFEIGTDGAITEVSYDQAEAVALTRTFLADPGRMLRYLLND
ncbi:putative ATPase [Actinoplanes lutulentus]|uniref:Putative ATPase n=1 Tax=Actinoplanes lutulentus TaxID=1287878 RepID=A0A327Z693_9ACTN|nr:AAA family ATPase [Actinoplanes lutulentus]MBB2948237.1 putative ATPase [Actinoplanes lutulentus]RAK31264.1 putative ATPase [Actinoplanes lutulentus]